MHALRLLSCSHHVETYCRAQVDFFFTWDLSSPPVFSSTWWDRPFVWPLCAQRIEEEEEQWHPREENRVADVILGVLSVLSASNHRLSIPPSRSSWPSIGQKAKTIWLEHPVPYDLVGRERLNLEEGEEKKMGSNPRVALKRDAVDPRGRNKGGQFRLFYKQRRVYCGTVILECIFWMLKYFADFVLNT